MLKPQDIQSVFEVPYFSSPQINAPLWFGSACDQVTRTIRKVLYQAIFDVSYMVPVPPPLPSLAREAYDTFLDRIRCVAIDHQFSTWHSYPSQQVTPSFFPVFMQS